MRWFVSYHLRTAEISENGAELPWDGAEVGGTEKWRAYAIAMRQVPAQNYPLRERM